VQRKCVFLTHYEDDLVCVAKKGVVSCDKLWGGAYYF